MEFPEPIIEKRLRETGEAEVIVQIINNLVEKHPAKFKDSPYFQFGKYYRDENLSISIKAFFQFDSWSKTYTVEVPGNDGRLVFCAEIIGEVIGNGNSRVGSVFVAEDSDGGISALKALE